MGMTIENVLEILEKHKLHIPSNVFYELKADIVNFEEPTTKNDLGVDCISRQAVIDLMIQKWGENFSGDSAMQESIDAIRVLPSVTLQAPNTGHWTDDGYCSCCNKQTLPLDISGYASGYDSFCPNCGAKMVEPQESEADYG